MGINNALMKCVGEAKLGGARGAGLDSGSKNKKIWGGWKDKQGIIA